jgi:anti-sigma-K factor RskA
MSALAEALVAAQRRSLATLEKAYVAGAIDAEQDARSEARYEQTSTDDASEQAERDRWGLGGAEGGPREETEA